ncbi:MAG TPA: hypothetical protein VFY93_05545 [Planctomycetota bacterium]|nr:hypothetical protein [Planctomycetota bacterium]
MRILAAVGLLVAVARAGPAELAYVQEPDPAKAEKLLAPLLAKYKTPGACEGLVKLLRGKRSYPAAKKDRETLDFACPDGKTRQFTYILPSKYGHARPAGVLFWLHGAIRQPAPGGGAGEAQMFRPAVEDLGLIVVGPSTYDGVEWGDPACRALVMHALDFVKTRFNVDENRVWIAGDSDGGRGTYATVETFAHFFGAAVPVIGAPGGVTRFLNFRNLPWFAINGGKDTIFTIDHVREAIDGMKAAGVAIEWKLVENGGHDPRFFLTYKDEVVSFLKAHPRDPYPKTVEWCIDPSRETGFPADTFRWIRIEEAGDSESNAAFDDEGGILGRGLPRVSATRDGNRVTMRTRGVKRVTLLVSDQMLDLKKDVAVTVNDRLLFRGKILPEARAILEEARRFKDRALVFSNRITLDVDAEAVPGEPAAGN